MPPSSSVLRYRRTTPMAAAGAAALLVLGSTPVHAEEAAPIYRDSLRAVDERVDDLMSRMSLNDKIGQMVQIERGAADAGAVGDHRLGAVLSAGGSTPDTNSPEAWADMYDGYQRAAVETPLGIPILYGVDAVHGHNNVRGATIFPHNIGLGAAGDPELVRRVAEATGVEIAATGIDWTFAPCVCVARDDRWGRTYESFGETPDLPSQLTSAVTGFQGETLGDSPTSVLATAKHYLGDGATEEGRDRGDAVVDEEELRAVHLPPFRAAVERGVGSVMISYSSWNGTKAHADRYLITDVLKEELGFTGIVVSDYDGVGRISGNRDFTPEEVRTGVNAGIDMIMLSKNHARFISDLRVEVEAGRVPRERVDDAVRRILTKKFELGLFEAPYADRDLLAQVGGDAHRELAREAVRASQVLLENDGVLPLAPEGGKVMVAGKNADDIGNQSGGWTISWQGSSGETTDGTTILDGIREVAQGTEIVHDREGRGIDDSFRAAIAVVGETPYAEYEGDRPDGLVLDDEDRATLTRLADSGVPVVVVMVSGRPLEIADEVGDWNGLVAAWLPGSEGAGVADVLFGRSAPTGRLPVTWMRTSDQQPINEGDGQEGLYPYGAGLSYDGAERPATEEAGEVPSPLPAQR
ncbi:glycoside hydrolase family 3 protein [Nocardiopsis mangrovi]|uniref:beta-glucosidase n=1 Tax=Nocardiopsis mangrovi TaxID=1179818 RepID=A0ABV9DY17_9ACTN